MFAINTAIENYTTITTKNVFAKAVELRADYPNTKRIIGIKPSVTKAVSAAYKTASGLADASGNIICDSIYKMSKLDVAVLISSNDKSADAIERSAAEIAKDAYITGNIKGNAKKLAAASGVSAKQCARLIIKEIKRMRAQLHSRTQQLSEVYVDSYGETPESPDAILYNIINHGGCSLLSLPTGYGKTSKIIEPSVADAIARGKKVLVISHRRSINSAICVGIDGMVSYDECTAPSIISEARGLKIVVNSLAAPKFRDFLESVDLVVIDEASQVISHVLGGEVKDREKVWDALNFVVKKAHTVVMSDADIDARCVKMVGWDHDFYTVDRKHSDITVKTAGIDQVRAMAIESAASGETTLVAIDGAKAAKALAAAITKRTGLEPLLITSESAKWKEQAAFIANPNTDKHQVVIYSPVITSSLSITSGHFKKHYGLFSGQVVPSDAIQMLRRDRTATEFVVGIKAPEYSKQEHVQATQKPLTALRAWSAINDADISEGLRETLFKALEFDIKPSAFEEARQEHLNDEAWLRDNIQSTLPAMLINQGFKIEVLAHSDELSKVGFVADSQGRKAVNAAASKKVLESARASASKVVAVNDAGSTDEKEHFEVVRARAEEVIGRSLDEEDAKIWKEGEGEGAINRFRKLMAHTASTDGSVYGMLKDATERMLNGKEWTSESSTDLFNNLNYIRAEVIRQGLSIGKASTPVAKQAAITKIMSQLGLKTKKVNGGKSGYYYIIKKESFDQMMKYVG